MNTQIQHLLALLVASGLSVFFGWANSSFLPYLQGQNPLVATLLGVLLTYAASWAAPFMSAFGANRKVVVANDRS